MKSNYYTFSFLSPIQRHELGLMINAKSLPFTVQRIHTYTHEVVYRDNKVVLLFALIKPFNVNRMETFFRSQYKLKGKQ